MSDFKNPSWTICFLKTGWAQCVASTVHNCDQHWWLSLASNKRREMRGRLLFNRATNFSYSFDRWSHCHCSPIMVRTETTMTTSCPLIMACPNVTILSVVFQSEGWLTCQHTTSTGPGRRPARMRQMSVLHNMGFRRYQSYCTIINDAS